MNTLVAGDNRAAIEKSNFSHLILSSASGDGRTDGSLNAVGTVGGAGIGGTVSRTVRKIRIAGGTVTAQGGNSGAAGIGGGNGGSAHEIEISGGIVTARGGEFATAIGGVSHENAPSTVYLAPPAGHSIAVRVGADEKNASSLEGSPFEAGPQMIAIGELVKNAAYFRSETREVSGARRHALTLTAEPSIGGSVRGAGNFLAGKRVAEAIPNDGYHFVRWTEGGREVSTDERYVFELHAPRNLVAVFEKDMASDWKKTVGNPSHAWTIRFNHALNPADVTFENFYVQDARGTRITGIRPVLLPDGTAVRMENGTRFEAGKTYFLIIRKGVRGAQAKPLKKDIVLKFRVQQ